MEQAVINEVINKLIDSGIAKPAEIRGCSEEEIDNLERQMAIKLPKVYREFLLRIGRQAGSFFEGTHLLLGQGLTGFKELLRKLLAENGNHMTLPTAAFVFLSHQDYQFNYFLLTDGDDPPVYFYVGAPEEYLEKKWNSFSEFLLDSAESQIRSEAEIKEMENQIKFLRSLKQDKES